MMRNFDIRDVIGGALLIAVGGFAAGYALASYELGTIRRIGPAMMPAALGVALAAIGLALLVQAMCRAGDRLPATAWRQIAAIVGSIAAFALVIGPFGLLPAIGALVAVSALANRSARALPTAVLAVSLGVLSVAIFRGVLGIYMPLLAWPLS